MTVGSPARVPFHPDDERVGAASPRGEHAWCRWELPRTLLVGLAAISREVDDLRRDAGACPDRTRRLDAVARDLDRLLRAVHDEPVRHLQGPDA